VKWTGHAFPIVIAAPSGTGKTTLARTLVERNDGVVFALSATTRAARADERDGRDYRFVDEATFDAFIEAGDLLEWAKVHSHRYGTLREGVERSLAAGDCPVLDIDVQGARRVRGMFDNAVLVFVLPPSAAELERRLDGRGTEESGERAVRLRSALAELGAVSEFDYIVVNDEFEDAVAALEGILEAERHRRLRYVALGERVSRLERMIRNKLGGIRDESRNTG
jgi:guanylate kinase